MKISTLSFALVVLATGCGSKVAFQGQTPIKIAGEAPAKPKPRPIIDKAARVLLTGNKIEIKEKIQFELNRAEIKQESFDLLNEVADVMKKHPEAKKIAIEGHASSDGSPQANLLLSDARAKSVLEYLVAKGGVERARLTAEGFGDKRPLQDNNTEEGRIANRRVEFNIVERVGKDGAVTKPDASKSDAPKTDAKTETKTETKK